MQKGRKSLWLLIMKSKPCEMADAMNKYFNEIGRFQQINFQKAHSGFLNYVNRIEIAFEIEKISVTEF